MCIQSKLGTLLSQSYLQLGAPVGPIERKAKPSFVCSIDSPTSLGVGDGAPYILGTRVLFYVNKCKGDRV